jgi:hypothetical protein
MVWGTRGRVREGVAPPAGGPGAWPPGKFFANRRRKYAFSRPCLGSICLFHQFIFGTKMSINLPFSSKCIHEVDNIFRMTTFVKYTGTAGCALTISGGSRNFVWGPSRLFPPSFLPLSSLPIPFLCITLIPSSSSLSHTTPLLPSCVPNPLLSLPSVVSSPPL